MDVYDFKNQAGTTAGVTVFAGPCRLGTVSINTGAASAVVTVYDSLSAAGTKVGTFQGVTAGVYRLDCLCRIGIFLVVAAGAADVTVTYR